MRVFCIFFICTCSAQLSMFHIERHSRICSLLLLLLLLLQTAATVAGDEYCMNETRSTLFTTAGC